MKKLALFTLILGVSSNTMAYTQGDVLTGDTKLACEALLCLATSTRPSECKPSLKRYFSIKARKPHDTFKARLNFLRLCPKDSGDINKEDLARIGIDQKDQEENMESLTNAIARLPHACEAETLNRQIEKQCMARSDRGNCEEWGYRVVPHLPKACKDLANHKWTQIKLPVYRGDYNWYSSPETPVWFDE